MNMNDPKECPTRMETPIRLLEKHLNNIALDPNETDQMNRAIALLKAHQSLCQCGPMPDDQNASLWVLEATLATHEEFHKAYKGTPKGELHLRCIREIEDALTVLRSSMEAPKESVEKMPLLGRCPKCGTFSADFVSTQTNNAYTSAKTSNLTFSEALEAVKRGKTVKRNAPVYLELGQHNSESYPICVADMIATDWSIVEEKP